MNNRLASPHQAGFTLIEMLVALVIFGLIAAASVSVMTFAIDNKEQVRLRGEEIGQLQRLHALLKADLSQAAARATRSPNGTDYPVSFNGGDRETGRPLLAFTRRGVENPGSEDRPTLQYVEYSLTEGRLERRVRPFLDGTDPGPPQTLSEDISAVQMRLLGRDGWIEVFSSSTTMALPRAVELRFVHKTLGLVRMVFLVPGEVR